MLGVDVRQPAGGAPSTCTHLPPSPQSAVPCGAPDVAGRIIHTHALMKVSIWPPHIHTLSQRNHTGTGTDTGKPLLSCCCCGIHSRYGRPRYRGTSSGSLRGIGEAEVAHRCQSLGRDREVKREASEWDKTRGARGGSFTRAEPRAHADKSRAAAWQRRHRRHSCYCLSNQNKRLDFKLFLRGSGKYLTYFLLTKHGWSGKCFNVNIRLGADWIYLDSVHRRTFICGSSIGNIYI